MCTAYHFARFGGLACACPPCLDELMLPLPRLLALLALALCSLLVAAAGAAGRHGASSKAL